MSYSDRFLKIPIELFIKKEDGTSSAKSVEGYAHINPFDISFYRDYAGSISRNGTPVIEGIVVTMKNGTSFNLDRVTRAEFSHWLSEHADNNLNP